MCFNAFKHYMFGWYSSQTRTVTGDWTGDIVAFVDAQQDTSKDVILKMGDVYMQFNRRKGKNAGTYEKADEIVLVQGFQGQKPSSVLEGLGQGEKYNVGTKTVEVCNMNFNSAADYATVSIYTTGSQSGCPSTKGTTGGTCQDNANAYFVVGGYVRRCSWVESEANRYDNLGLYWSYYNNFCVGLASTYCKESCRKCS